MKRSMAVLSAALILSAASVAHAQADENALFGGAPEADAGAPEADAGPVAAPMPEVDAGPRTAQETQEDSLLAGQAEAASAEVAPMNPLTIGGTLYLRGQLTGYDSHPPSEWGWSMPNLMDVYLDARPNSRVRALAVGRLTYDPTIDPNLVQFNGTHLSQTNTYLDQLWINFDIARDVFVTAGKQHVKWGTGRFWNPTDFLQPVRLNPLDLFDERTGVTLLKAHVPWEARGWNFYAFGVFQGAQLAGENAQVANVLQRIGGAAKAQIVLGPAELSLDTLVQHGQKPRFGADLSSGLGPFDVYAEAAFHGADTPKLQVNLPSGDGPISKPLISFNAVTGVQPQVTAGGTWQVNLNDRDALTVGLEGFYNALGYDDATVYPALIFTGQYTPFYVGRFYGGAYALAQLPRGQVTHSITFSTLSNLSDQSYISRLDYNVVVLTHLSVDVYGDVHYGTDGGEFRFGFNSASIPQGTGEIPQVVVPTPLFDAGIALRVAM